MTHFKLYSSTSELPIGWDALPVEDVFLKTEFLSALETSSPSNISTYFLAVYSSEVLVGIAIIQRVEMYLDDVFRRTSNKFFKRIGKYLISKLVKGNALIVGNLMHTGQHGLYYDSECISQEAFLAEVEKGLKALTKLVFQQFGKKIRIIGFKDYFEGDWFNQNNTFSKHLGLYKAKVQPNMIFKIQSNWKSANDYVQAFNKKYRRRFNTARKKSKDIVCRELDVNDVRSHSEQLYTLYENVSNNAGVNSFKLHPDHFYQLKLKLEDNFKVYGYTLNSQLIGFYTFIKNYDTMETYFLGYDPDLQHKHQMYLNMLFDMAIYGIENKHKQVVFARTAMEIKSSIGAKPFEMFIYVKHTHNFIANTILKLAVKYGNPVRDWEERHPF